MRFLFLAHLIAFGICSAVVGQTYYLTNTPFDNARIQKALTLSDSVPLWIQPSVQPFYQGDLRYIQDELPDRLVKEHADLLSPSITPETSLRKHLFRNGVDLVHVQRKDFNLKVNPVIGFRLWSDNLEGGLQYESVRGGEIKGSIDDKIGFYLSLTEHLMFLPTYQDDFFREYGVVPGYGFWKEYETDGYDLFRSRGYLTASITKHIQVQAGVDWNKIGEGYRSLILSGFADEYPFVKIRTRLWRFEYTNIFAQLVASDNRIPGTPNPKKFMTLHYLTFAAHKNVQFGLFETVFHARQSGDTQTFDLAYANPLIFYRAVEQDLGDGDNVLLGFDFRATIKKRIRLYSQLLLDEFRADEIFAGNGWRGNKWAYQLGAWYYDVAGIPWIDAMAEFNTARPYTYTHFDRPEFTNYQHYQQPLAHPLGANFREVIGQVFVNPHPKWQFHGLASYATKGLDTDERNFGGDILRDYSEAIQEYGNETGQGLQTDILFAQGTLTYLFKPLIQLDASLLMRRQDNIQATQNETVFSIGLRWNYQWKERVF